MAQIEKHLQTNKSMFVGFNQDFLFENWNLMSNCGVNYNSQSKSGYIFTGWLLVVIFFVNISFFHAKSQNLSNFNAQKHETK